MVDGQIKGSMQVTSWPQEMACISYYQKGVQGLEELWNSSGHKLHFHRQLVGFGCMSHIIHPLGLKPQRACSATP